MYEIINFKSGGWGPGDDYQISLSREDDVFYLRGVRVRNTSWDSRPQTLQHSVKVSSDWVTCLLSELQNATIAPLPPEVLGCDGDFYSLSVGTSYGGATYRWWSSPPKGWEIFPKVARQIMNEFSKELPE